mmetsp:Transcript_22429/g.44262  ORF Transcript_22429/g.44262 Transcript_22429/m.44262 type:complete len:220 (-) Transcript_22429:237-896(-)
MPCARLGQRPCLFAFAVSHARARALGRVAAPARQVEQGRRNCVHRGHAPHVQLAAWFQVYYVAAQHDPDRGQKRLLSSPATAAASAARTAASSSFKRGWCWRRRRRRDLVVLFDAASIIVIIIVVVIILIILIAILAVVVAVDRGYFACVLLLLVSLVALSRCNKPFCDPKHPLRHLWRVRENVEASARHRNCPCFALLLLLVVLLLLIVFTHVTPRLR